MKKVSKIIAVVVIALILFTISTQVFAIDPSGISGTTTGTDKVQDLGKRILGIIQVVGSIAAVAVLAVVGIKYMMGSAEEKAEYKKVMIPYIIGAVCVFAASNLAGVIYDFAQSI